MRPPVSRTAPRSLLPVAVNPPVRYMSPSTRRRNARNPGPEPFRSIALSHWKLPPM